ncbi:trypsin-like peptidase domain-containing protein [Herbivorax sp. ANBcel31]|uniref:S1C family serine protease n=1 Tax=Herbivorax sp. ANBcel31 TaxID=3069754 RepID=UPI0027B2A87E|nr:trypsin-like peptidase domain-containing protein [Herbivorax sp. ANBcel31]MDQ2087387.1 trypsin-like peptidase domain-containing protein [Herbivorax sp. ANBcel31]
MTKKQYIIMAAAILVPFILAFGFIGILHISQDNTVQARTHNAREEIEPTPSISDQNSLEDKEPEATSSIPIEKTEDKSLYTINYEDIELPFTEIAKLNKYVCIIQTDYTLGSGVIINNQGYILTNYHVVNEGNISVAFQDENYYINSDFIEAKLIDYSEADDIALIHVDGLSLDGFIEFAPKDKITLGEKVVTIGSSEGLFNTLSFGHITGLREAHNGKYIQTDAAISMGNSGGALLNKKGQLIGITSFKLLKGENLNFALSNEIILNFLDTVEIE